MWTDSAIYWCCCPTRATNSCLPVSHSLLRILDAAPESATRLRTYTKISALSFGRRIHRSHPTYTRHPSPFWFGVRSCSPPQKRLLLQMFQANLFQEVHSKSFPSPHPVHVEAIGEECPARRYFSPRIVTILLKNFHLVGECARMSLLHTHHSSNEDSSSESKKTTIVPSLGPVLQTSTNRVRTSWPALQHLYRSV